MKYIIAILAAFLMSMAPQRADAQENTVKAMNVVSGNFGQGALVACFALPDDQQDTGCWIYNSTENHIGFHHANGVGPTMFQPLKAGASLVHLGVSDDGRFMTMVLKDSARTIVEVHTLLRRETRNQRLAGISTPRLYFRLVADGARSASVAKGNLMVVFTDSIKVYEMRPRIFLPMVGSDKCTPPECVRGGATEEPPPTLRPTGPTPTPSACDEDPECPGTPVVLPPGPRDTPEPWPTPAVATARP